MECEFEPPKFVVVLKQCVWAGAAPSRNMSAFATILDAHTVGTASSQYVSQSLSCFVVMSVAGKSLREHKEQVLFAN